MYIKPNTSILLLFLRLLPSCFYFHCYCYCDFYRVCSGDHDDDHGDDDRFILF